MQDAEHHSVLATLLRCVRRYLDSHGFDPETFFESFGLDLDVMNRPRARYPEEPVAALLAGVCERFNEPLLGFALASHHRITDLHSLGVAMYAADTPRFALEQFIDNQRLVSTEAPFDLIDETGFVRLGLHLHDFGDATSVVEEFLLKVLLDTLRASVGADFGPLEVGFTRSRPMNIGPHLVGVGAPVSFGHPSAYLLFDGTELARAMGTGNDEIVRQSTPFLEDLLASVTGEDLVADLRRTLLSTGLSKTSRQALASAMQMAEHELDAQLEHRGLGHEALVADLQRQLSNYLLAVPDIPLHEVASACGYVDEDALKSAVEAREGSSLGHYRGTLRQTSLHSS